MNKFAKILGILKTNNKAQTFVKVTNANNETDKVLLINPYGFKSMPFNEDAFITSVTSNPNVKVMLGGVFNGKEIEEGDVLIYSNGNEILLKNNGNIEISSNATININSSDSVIVKGDVKLGTDNASLTPLTKEDVESGFLMSPQGAVTFVGKATSSKVKIS